MIRVFFFLLGFHFSLLGLASPPHLELELTSSDYQRLLETQLTDGGVSEGILFPVMNMGKRNLDWLKHINRYRAPENQLSFSSAASQVAYPIENPRLSNPKLILEENELIRSELPDWFRAILCEGAEFTTNPPVSDTEYIKLGMQIDSNYQRASRWILQEPYLEEYSALKSNDIRSFHFFKTDSTHKQLLSNWGELSTETQTKYIVWLADLCLNAAEAEESNCQEELSDVLKKEPTPIRYLEKYLPDGEKKWSNFFKLNVKRSDVQWEDSLMIVPFLEPSNAGEVKPFLIENIEEEWRWKNWKLQLIFMPHGFFPNIVFVQGATPNVDSLGGNTITMDANQPLNQYNVRWTIRHEFGHVLGFPDCYVEFYDKKQEVMVSYQLDTSNLMCSRRGHIKETHFEELKRVYAETL